jgi:small subunit ribosomal protein S14
MAKKSKIVRQQQRQKLVAKYRDRRAELRRKSIDIKLNLEERMEARASLDLLPRDSSHVRLRNRCLVTGRSRGFLRRFGISRVLLRRLAHAGVMPGLTKSSW